MLPEPNLPNMKSIRGHTTAPSTGHTTAPTFSFAMVPEAVLSDPNLNHRDVHVYCILAAGRRGPLVSIGGRRIGQGARIARRSVRTSISKLVDGGHVEIIEGVKGSRARYKLTSPLFSGVKVDQASTSSRQAKKKSTIPEVDWIFCPLCQQRRPKLLKVGWCRSCNWSKRVQAEAEPVSRRVSREEIEKSKREVA